MRMPKDWSWAEGAAFRVGATTAYHSLVHRAGLKKREVLLVHGASGGVGMAAVQLGKHLGAQVIATGCERRAARRGARAGRRSRGQSSHRRLRRRREGHDRRPRRRRDLRSGGWRGAGEIHARRRLWRAFVGGGLHFRRPDQDHVQPRADQGPLHPGRTRWGNPRGAARRTLRGITSKNCRGWLHWASCARTSRIVSRWSGPPMLFAP